MLCQCLTSLTPGMLLIMTRASLIASSREMPTRQSITVTRLPGAVLMVTER